MRQMTELLEFDMTLQIQVQYITEQGSELSLVVVDRIWIVDHFSLQLKFSYLMVKDMIVE